MKRRLLPILVCPSCTSSLNLEVSSEDRGEIQEGTLSCRSCQSGFPIRKGVPRFVFPMSPHPNPRWRWLDTFDWYSPKYQHKHTWPEVYGWYLEQDFENIRLNQETKAGKPL